MYTNFPEWLHTDDGHQAWYYANTLHAWTTSLGMAFEAGVNSTKNELNTIKE